MAGGPHVNDAQGGVVNLNQRCLGGIKPSEKRNETARQVTMGDNEDLLASAVHVSEVANHAVHGFLLIDQGAIVMNGEPR